MKTLNFWQVSICATAMILMSFEVDVLSAQQLGNKLNQQTFIDSSVQQLDVVVGSSRRLKFGYKIPELLVENPEIIKATPVAPTEILVSGLKPGFSTVTISDPEKNLQTISIRVTVDTRILQAALFRQFPEAKINVHALQTGVVLNGTVARADQINTVVAIARDYFPTTVINQLQVDSGQVIATKVKIYEVNRSKLRTLGVDWAIFGSDFGIASSVSEIIQSVGLAAGNVTSSGAETFSVGVFDGNNTFFKFMEALEEHNLAKLLDQPTLVAQNGRPAEFLSGGEIPISISNGIQGNTIEFRAFGTKLDIVPIIHGQGELTLEVRAEVSDVDNSLSFGSGVPGFRVRRVNTAVRMKAGHTLALAGDYQEQIETVKRGIPFLMDSPIWGSLFRRTSTTKLETELVFMLTPRFIKEVDPTVVPRLGPGQLSDTPSRSEQYFHGYVEVPRCNDNCPTNDRFDDPANQSYPNFSGSSETQPGKQVEQQLPANSSFQQSGFGADPNRRTGKFPVYQSNEGPQAVPDQGSYGAGFGWPQRN